MQIQQLLVTQNSLRDIKQLIKMIEFVKAGGRFTKDARLAQSLLSDQGRGLPPPMHIAAMEDGRLFLHDGHHRAVAMYLGGRNKIFNNEYVFADYRYDDYSLPNPDNGWFTPFDLDTECRLPDFWNVKFLTRSLYQTGNDWESAMNNNRKLYAESRIVWTVKELAERYKL